MRDGIVSRDVLQSDIRGYFGKGVALREGSGRKDRKRVGRVAVVESRSS